MLFRSTAPTPASDNLFDVDEDSELLNEKEADFFHRSTARLLFAAKGVFRADVIRIWLLCDNLRTDDFLQREECSEVLTIVGIFSFYRSSSFLKLTNHNPCIESRRIDRCSGVSKATVLI